MPNKKKKYNARFPPARIKKIMQTDEEVGKVAAAVPVIISRALELFVESLIRKTSEITLARNAKTLTPAHLKQCIAVESQFDFLKDVVASVPDVQGDDDSSNPPPGDTTPLPQSKNLPKPQKKHRRKFSKNNGDDGPGSSHIVSTESEEETEEDDEDDDDDDVATSRIEDYSLSDRSRTANQDVSSPKHRITNPLPNGATSVIMKPQTSSFSYFSLPSATASIQGMDEDYDS